MDREKEGEREGVVAAVWVRVLLLIEEDQQKALSEKKEAISESRAQN
jgi:hypothetical protein